MKNSSDDLIYAYLDGTLSSSQEHELQNLLKTDPDARATLRRRAAIDEHLGDLAQTESYLAPVSTPNTRKNTLAWSVAAILILTLVCVGFFMKSSDVIEKPDNIIGHLINQDDAEFDPEFTLNDFKFESKRYRLEQGVIHFQLKNGAEFIVKGPADFQIENMLLLTLHRGNLRAIIPNTAQGFVVSTPGIEYEDLGTEFGVSVETESGKSKLHVFDGQVDVRKPNSNEVLSSVFAGESRLFSNNELKPTAGPMPGDYPTPSEVGLHRWQRWSLEIVQDPSLILYYPFVKDPTASTQIRNEAANSDVSGGSINGARWVSGRWPGKEALLFDRSQDYVSLNIPDTLEELTITAWVKADSLDEPLSSILCSNGWDDGDLHFQVRRTGVLVGGLYSSSYKRLNMQEIFETGVWSHVTMVISVPNGYARAYVNGQQSWNTSIGNDSVIRLGDCRLGNWFNTKTKTGQRAFRGRIDELAIWKRALSESEILKNFQASRPALQDKSQL